MFPDVSSPCKAPQGPRVPGGLPGLSEPWPLRHPGSWQDGGRGGRQGGHEAAAAEAQEREQLFRLERSGKGRARDDDDLR